MFTSPQEVLDFIKNEEVVFVDIRFTDMPGVQQHFNLPAKAIDDDFFVNGQLFDGSSIRGFQGIAESDMQLIPDVQSAYVDPFRIEKTLVIICSIPAPASPTTVTPAASLSVPRRTCSPPALQTPRSSHPRLNSSSSRTSATRLSRTPYSSRSTPMRLPGTPAARKRAATWATRPPSRAATSPSPPSTSRLTCVTQCA